MNLDLGVFELQKAQGEGYYCPAQGCVANCPNGPAVATELPEVIIIG